MGVALRINPTATADMQEIKKYLAKDSDEVATKTIKEIISNIENLTDFPELGLQLMYKIKLKSNYRYIICGQYIVFYVYEKDAVLVQRVLHGKRDIISLLK